MTQEAARAGAAAVRWMASRCKRIGSRRKALVVRERVMAGYRDVQEEAPLEVVPGCARAPRAPDRSLGRRHASDTGSMEWSWGKRRERRRNRRALAHLATQRNRNDPARSDRRSGSRWRGSNKRIPSVAVAAMVVSLCRPPNYRHIATRTVVKVVATVVAAAAVEMGDVEAKATSSSRA